MEDKSCKLEAVISWAKTAELTHILSSIKLRTSYVDIENMLGISCRTGIVSTMCSVRILNYDTFMRIKECEWTIQERSIVERDLQDCYLTKPLLYSGLSLAAIIPLLFFISCKLIWSKSYSNDWRIPGVPHNWSMFYFRLWLYFHKAQ